MRGVVLIVFPIACCLSAASAADAADPWKSAIVLPKSAQVRLVDETGRDSGSVIQIDWPAKIERINGQWLLICDSGAYFSLCLPFNPPHIIPLVEVVGGTRTSPEAIEQAIAFYASIGKKPIRLRKEFPGHVAVVAGLSPLMNSVEQLAKGEDEQMLGLLRLRDQPAAV
jgi:hypothetical protein